MELSLSDVQALTLVVACAGLAVVTIASSIRWAILAAFLAEAAFALWIGSLTATLAAAVLLVLALCVGMIVRLMRSRALDAERVLIESLAAADARRAAAVLAERAHMARELHDLLAHSLAGLAIQLEHTRLEAARLPSGESVAQQVGAAHEMAVRGMDDARTAVGALRGDPSVTLVGMRELADEFSKVTGIELLFEAPTAEPELSIAAWLVLFRTMQEALTNASKHASPTVVGVRLEVDARQARLSVTNDGCSTGPPTSAKVSGYGLQGITERVALMAGTFTAGRLGDEFEVVVCLPR